MNTQRKFHVFWISILLIAMLGPLAGCMCVYILPPGEFPADEWPVDGGTQTDTTEIALPDEPIQEELPETFEELPEEIVEPEPEPEPTPECVDGEKERCKTGELGVCELGERFCSEGKWGKCKRLENPSREVCDGLDNDCDGDVDEKLVRRCPYSGPKETENVSHCRAGSQSCKEGQWSECTGESLPVPEVCNGKDDDCDGAVDDFLPIQQVGIIRTYSTKGDPSHLYMVSNQQGYAFGWSETGTQKVYLTRVRADGSRRTGSDWVVTPGNEYGNVHGLTYNGKDYAVAWDTDSGGQGGDAFVALVNANGKRIQGPQLLAKGGRMVNPQVSSGPNRNRFGVVWSDFANLKLFAQVLDGKLKPIAPPLSFQISTNVSPYPGSSFSGDRMGVTWVDRTNQLRFAVLDKAGKQISSNNLIPYAGKTPKDPNLTGDNNGFLVVWSDVSSGKLWGQRIDRNGKPVGTPNEFAANGAQTPILKATDFGGVVAWVQSRLVNSIPKRGIAIGRIDKNGKLLASPSWTQISDVEPYLALAWTDLGKGRGRGAIAWIDRRNNIKLAPLGCQK